MGLDRWSRLLGTRFFTKESTRHLGMLGGFCWKIPQNPSIVMPCHDGRYVFIPKIMRGYLEKKQHIYILRDPHMFHRGHLHKLAITHAYARKPHPLSFWTHNPRWICPCVGRSHPIASHEWPEWHRRHVKSVHSIQKRPNKWCDNPRPFINLTSDRKLIRYFQ